MTKRKKKKIKFTAMSHPIEAHDNLYYFAHESLFCFGNESKFRINCVWLITWTKFENFLTLCILINALNIASTNYSERMTGIPQSGFVPIFKGYLD